MVRNGRQGVSNNKDLMQQSVASFVDATAAKVNTPGGGSVAGVVGALGAALGEMALGFTRGKQEFAEHEGDFARIAVRLAKVRGMFAELVVEDVAAFELYQQASSGDGPDKDEAVQAALTACIDVPREMAKLALAVLDDLASLTDRCAKRLLSDLAAGAVLAEAVVKLSDYNVRINVGGVADQAAAGEVLQSSIADCAKARDLAGRIEAEVQSRLS